MSEREGGREGGRERERERERQTDRQTDRQTETDTESRMTTVDSRKLWPYPSVSGGPRANYQPTRAATANTSEITRGG